MMLKRGLALCVVLAFASVAGAQTVNVGLTKIPDQVTYTPGQNVSVDVLLSQSGTDSNIAKSLRFVQLDVNASDSSLLAGATLPATHTGPNPDVLGWDFAVTPECTGTPNSCGSAYFLEAVAGLNAPAPRNRIMSAAYKELAVDANRQWIIPANLGLPAPTVKVARINLTLPMIAGTYNLNVMNAAGTGDRGAEVRWGFGLAQNDPLVVKRAQDGGITGGTASFTVGGPVCNVNLASSFPPFTAEDQAFVSGSSLWRNQRNTIRLTFGGAITLPTTDQLLIQEILPGDGNYGPNLNTGVAFQMTLESGNTVLRIRELPVGSTAFTNRKWYAVRSPNGWGSVCGFNAQYVTQFGDQTGDGVQVNADVLAINASPLGPSPAPSDQSRNDVNGDGARTAADVTTANSFGTGGRPAKPAGH